MADETAVSGRAPAWWPGTQPWLSLVARLGLAAMWLYYSVPKLGQLDANVGAVRAFQILPNSFDHTIGYAQPFLEMALGLLLILGLGTRFTAALSALVLLVYIGGIISLGARGIAINCGCGGVASQAAAGHTRYTLDVLRDVGYLVPAAWLLWKPRSRFALDGVLLMDDDEEPTPPPRPGNRTAAARTQTAGRQGPGQAASARKQTSKPPQNSARTRNAR